MGSSPKKGQHPQKLLWPPPHMAFTSTKLPASSWGLPYPKNHGAGSPQPLVHPKTLGPGHPVPLCPQICPLHWGLPWHRGLQGPPRALGGGLGVVCSHPKCK